MADQKKVLRVDVISDCVCPYCYIGKHHLDEAVASVADRFDVEVTWHPFQLNPDVPREGRDWATYAVERFGSLERLQSMQGRIVEMGKAAAIPFAFDRITRAANTFDAHRLLWLSADKGVQHDVAERLFRANFVEGEDIGDRDTLVRIAEAAGMDAAGTRALLGSDAGAAEVEQGIDQAHHLGVTGVPFFIVDRRLAAVGAQPPEALVELLEQAAAAPAG